MPSKCEFILLKDREVYYANDEPVLGNVSLLTTNPKDVECIKIKFWGGSKCSYYVNDSLLPLKHYRGTSEKVFVESEQFVFSEGVLPAGKHEWPFSFVVPSHAFTSMESRYCQIRYQISLEIINKEGKYKNIFIKSITVIQPLDLNKDHSNRFPQEVEKEYSSCFSDSTTYELQTPFKGYVPGQMMKFKFNIQNKSRDRILFYEIRLVKIINFKLYEPQYSEHEDRITLTGCDVLDNGESNQVIEKEIIIPSTPPSFESPLISVKYILRIRTDIYYFSRNIQAELPIVVGTVPLKETLTAKQLAQVVIGIDEITGAEYIKNFKDPLLYQRAYNPKGKFIDYKTEAINQDDEFLPYYPRF